MAQIEVEAGTAERLQAGANARGISVSAYLAKLVELAEPANPQVRSSQSVQEFDRALDELFAAETYVSSEDDRTWSRSEIYADHD